MGNEEQVLFRNSLEPVRSTHQQAFKRMLSGATKVKEILLFVFVAALFLLAVVPGILRGDTPVYKGSELLFWTTVVLFVLLVLLFYVVPYIFSGITMNAQLKNSGGQAVRMENEFRGDRILVRNCVSGTVIEVPYGAIIRCAESKDLLLLQTTAKNVILLAKNGFEGADEKDFRAFIQKKCPNARFMWKKSRA